MVHATEHPTDLTLILSIDRELSERGRIALARHLTVCGPCRSRLAAFEDALDDASHVCRDEIRRDTVAQDALRARLQSRMTELSARWDRSPWFRVRKALASVPLAARVGISAGLLALAVNVVRSAPEVAPPTAAPLTEALPYRLLTPGAVSSVGAANLCAGSLPARAPIPNGVRQTVLHQYRMEDVPATQYELDYLITPELGGIGDARNLWPQRYDAGAWNARVKDDLEQLLPRLVCDGTVDLATAQNDIAANWIDAYKKYFNTDRPIARQGGIVDDDDEIRFESGEGAVPKATASRVVVSARISLSVGLNADTEYDAPRARRVAWP